MTKRLCKITSAALILPTAILISTAPVTYGSAAQAENNARVAAQNLRAQGYDVTAHNFGSLPAGAVDPQVISIQPGMDYIILIAGDRPGPPLNFNAHNIDVWIEDEFGQIVGSDPGAGPDDWDAAVIFRATYAGQVGVNIHMKWVGAGFPPVGSWAMLVGSRQGMRKSFGGP